MLLLLSNEFLSLCDRIGEEEETGSEVETRKFGDESLFADSRSRWSVQQVVGASAAVSTSTWSVMNVW